MNAYWYRAADIEAARQGVDFDEARLTLTEDLNRDLGVDVDDEAHSHGTLPPEWEDRQGEYFDEARDSGFEILMSEPVLWGKQLVRGLYSQFAQSGWDGSFEFLSHGRSAPAPYLAIGLLFVWGIEALALVGMGASVLHRSSVRLAHVLLVALLAYVVMVSAGPEAAAGARFRAPLWALWSLYAFVGADVVFSWSSGYAIPIRTAASP